MSLEHRIKELEREIEYMRSQLGTLDLQQPQGNVMGGRVFSAMLKSGETLTRGGSAQAHLVQYVRGLAGGGAQSTFSRASVSEIVVRDVGSAATPPGKVEVVGGGKIPTGTQLSDGTSLDVVPVDDWYRLVGFDCDGLEDVP